MMRRPDGPVAVVVGFMAHHVFLRSQSVPQDEHKGPAAPTLFIRDCSFNNLFITTLLSLASRSCSH